VCQCIIHLNPIIGIKHQQLLKEIQREVTCLREHFGPVSRLSFFELSKPVTPLFVFDMGYVVLGWSSDEVEDEFELVLCVVALEDCFSF
jgi:hypothetical protein